MRRMTPATLTASAAVRIPAAVRTGQPSGTVYGMDAVLRRVHAAMPALSEEEIASLALELTGEGP